MTKERPRALFVGSREVREIPKGWRHPTDPAGKHVPLLPADYWSDEPVGLASLMPKASGLAEHETEIAACETTTEGTPISPPFPNTPEGRRDMLGWCAEHCFTLGRNRAGAEAWAAILFGEAAVTIDGAVVAEG